MLLKPKARRFPKRLTPRHNPKEGIKSHLYTWHKHTKQLSTAGGRGFYVGKDGQTTNAVKNFFGNFKRSMKGTHRFCSEQHMARYFAKFEFRHNNRSGLGIEDGERTAIALKGAEGWRLTYRPSH